MLMHGLPMAVEAVLLGFVGVWFFRRGFYSNREWLCVVAWLTIVAATAIFVLGIARALE